MTLFKISESAFSSGDAEEETTEEEVEVDSELSSEFGDDFLRSMDETENDKKESENKADKSKSTLTVTEDALSSQQSQTEDEQEEQQEQVASEQTGPQFNSESSSTINSILSSSANIISKVEQNVLRSLSEENVKLEAFPAVIIAVLSKNASRKGYNNNNILFIKKFSSEGFTPIRYVIFRKSIFSERIFKPIATINAEQAKMDNKHKRFIKNKFPDIKLENLFSFVDNDIHRDGVYAYRIETHYRDKTPTEAAKDAHEFITPSISDGAP